MVGSLQNLGNNEKDQGINFNQIPRASDVVEKGAYLARANLHLLNDLEDLVEEEVNYPQKYDGLKTSLLGLKAFFTDPNARHQIFNSENVNCDQEQEVGKQFQVNDANLNSLPSDLNQRLEQRVLEQLIIGHSLQLIEKDGILEGFRRGKILEKLVRIHIQLDADCLLRIGF